MGARPAAVVLLACSIVAAGCSDSTSTSSPSAPVQAPTPGATPPTAAPGSTTTITSTTTTTTSPTTTPSADLPQSDLEVTAPTACQVLDWDDPQLQEFDVTSVFVPPTPDPDALIPGSLRVVEPATLTDGTANRVTVTSPVHDGLTAVAVTYGDPGSILTVVGEHDLDEGTFSPKAAVGGCPPLNSDVSYPAFESVRAADGATWSLLGSRGGVEVLRVDPNGGFDVVARWGPARQLVATRTQVLAVGYVGDRPAVGTHLVARFELDGTAPSTAEPLGRSPDRITVSPQGAVHHAPCPEDAGSCTALLLDEVGGAVLGEVAFDPGWRLLGPGPDGIWFSSDESIEFRTPGSPTAIARFPLPDPAESTATSSHPVVPDPLPPEHPRSQLLPTGEVALESVLPGTKTVVLEVLTPQGDRQELLRYQSHLETVSRSYYQTLHRALLAPTEGGLRYGDWYVPR